MSEKNKRIARRVFEDVQSQGNQAIIKEIVTEDYVGHTPLGDIHGPEGAKQFTSMLRAGFPDFQVTVEAQIAEGDLVATRWTCRGTHNGEFQGVPPTGKRMTVSGMAIFRIANSKLVEGWTNPDLLGIMQQLGVVLLPEGVN